MRVRFAALLFVLLSCVPWAAGEQLPVKNYTIADGLVRDSAEYVGQDSRGFLWFCTVEGISQFDGYTFKNYGIADGLPHRVVNTFLETRDGDHLFGTERGLVEFNPNGPGPDGSYFTLIDLRSESSYIAVLASGPEGSVWVGTATGLYKLMKNDGVWSSQLVEMPFEPAVNIAGLMPDPDGGLWATDQYGFFRLHPDGTWEHYGTENGLPQYGLGDIVRDRSGRVWAGSSLGLVRLVDEPRPGTNVVDRIYTTKDGLGHIFMDCLFTSSDGRLWVGTRGGLNVLVDPENHDGAAFHKLTENDGGIPNIRIQCLFEDSDNNLWVGPENGGIKKIPLAGFESFYGADGLGTGRINQVIADKLGNDHILSCDPGDFSPSLCRVADKRLINERLDMPPGTKLSWGWNQQMALDPDGNLWLGTLHGIYEFSVPEDGSFDHLKPKRHFTTADGMDDDQVFRLYIDPKGDVLFSTVGVKTRSCFSRLDRQTGRITVYTPEDVGHPPGTVTAFVNDPRDGSLWIGFYTGGITHVRDEQFVNYTEQDGVPPGFIRHLFFDSQHRLWVATSLGGVARVDDSNAERLSFVTYTRADGISSNQVTTVVEDRWGQIYLGTGRGIDRLNIDNGAISKIKHYTTADGLADNFVNHAFRDPNGVLWFGTLRGVSRLVPQQDRPRAPPPIMISGVSTAGQTRRISELGASSVATPELNYDQNQVQIDFVSISYAAGDTLRYQYRFDDTDSDWSPPSSQRSITLANLAPGSYRFLVRAVNSDGVISPQPANVSFTILAPLWRRWWFIALAVLLVVFLAVGFYIYRTSQLRRINLALTEAKRAEVDLRLAREQRLTELEKVRTRIATDLHDDIGASLTQIAILSEIARAQTGNANGAAEPLSKISETSNELVGTMSDIVWAINPAKDHVSDLTQRMRRFGSDVLSLKSIRFHFNSSEDAAGVVVKSNLRREIFLVFKESINNIVKHAEAKNVWTEIDIADGRLTMNIRDDGKGFDLTDAMVRESGNGLASMRRRTVEIGGEFEIKSAPGKPTVISVSFPVEDISSTIA